MAGLILASAMSVAMTGTAWSQTPAAKSAAATQAAPAVTPAAAPAPAAGPAPQAVANPPPPQQATQPARTACNNPNALGVARTVEIDTTGGPGFGFEHFK